MSLVNEHSPVTAIPELDFYSKAAVQTSIETTYNEEIRPIAQLNSGGHIEFIINNAINEYLKLKETTLYVRFKVKLSRSDTAAISDTDWTKVSVVNNFLHSLWNQIDLSIGDSQTTTSLQTYPYRAYFETILGSTPHGRKTHLSTTLFTEDDMSSGKCDVPQTGRMEFISSNTTSKDIGRECEIEGKLHLDMFMQHRALIGGTKLKIRLIPNKPNFYFMCSDDKLHPTIHFEDIHLNIVKFRVSDEVLLAQMQALNVSPAKYILNRGEVRSVTIDGGATSRNIENVINGKLPRRVYVAFTSNDAYSGSFKKNPFFLNHFKINSLSCFVNGEQIPRKAYTPDFENDKYVREYLELYRVSEQLDNDARMQITKKNFKEGYTIFAFNLSQDLSQGYSSNGYVNLPKEGVMRFEINFKEQLASAINALIYCEFDNQLSISEDRNAFMDYR